MRAVAGGVVVLLFLWVGAGGTAPLEDPSTRLVGGVTIYETRKGDSLRAIGSRHGIDPAVLASENGLRVDRPLAIGQSLRIDNRHIVPAGNAVGAILINVPQRMLFFDAGERIFHAPIAVGSRGWQTPVAPFTIVLKEADPTWDVPASIAAEARAKGRPLPARVPPGPVNPLGRHWLGLSIGSVGVHGTNAPTSIYQAVTHGCMRMHPEDIAVLFDLVEEGTAGSIVYQPILLGEDGGEIWLEVHPDIYRQGRGAPLAQARALAASLGLDGRIDWSVAGRVVAARDGIARVVTLR